MCVRKHFPGVTRCAVTESCMNMLGPKNSRHEELNTHTPMNDDGQSPSRTESEFHPSVLEESTSTIHNPLHSSLESSLAPQLETVPSTTQVPMNVSEMTEPADSDSMYALDPDISTFWFDTGGARALNYPFFWPCLETRLRDMLFDTESCLLPDVGATVPLDCRSQHIETPKSTGQTKCRSACCRTSDMVLPFVSSDDMETAAAEIYGHVRIFPDEHFETIQKFYLFERSGGEELVTKAVFHAFLELYFEHFDAQLPFVHSSSMEAPGSSWILLLALATVGSRYSGMSIALPYSRVLLMLLEKAVDHEIPCPMDSPSISFVQSVLLRDICRFASGSIKCHMRLAYERNTIPTLCRKLGVDPGPSGNSSEYEDWLCGETKVRLFHGVYVVECLQLVFYDLPPLVALEELTRLSPCDEHLWTCQGASTWSTAKERMLTPQKSPLTTLCETLGSYAGTRTFLDTLRTSTLVTSALTTELRKSLESTIAGAMTSHSTALSHASTDGCLAHVIAILRHVPLKTLYAVLGWRTSESGMRLSRDKMQRFVQSKSSVARQCLVHATCIFASLRASQHWAFHDPLSLCMALHYIIAYDCATCHPGEGEGEVIRLDRDGQELNDWLARGGTVRLHITGIGILNGRQSVTRSIVDAVKTLKSRTAWQGLSRGLAACFEQSLRGEMPSYAAE
ncbi:hypothetical protein ACN47E_008890 [Coniothyrium glycines]